MALVEKGLKDHLVSMPPLGVGLPTTTADCLKLHQAWPYLGEVWPLHAMATAIYYATP